MEFSLREGLSTMERQLFGLLSIYKRTRFLPLDDIQSFRDAALELGKGGAPLSQLWSLDHRGISMPVVWWMIWHQDLCLDWTTQVNSDTVVRSHSPDCTAVADEMAILDDAAHATRRCGPHPRELIGPDADRRASNRLRRLTVVQDLGPLDDDD